MIDTSGLPEKSTELANLLAEKIRTAADDIEALLLYVYEIADRRG